MFHRFGERFPNVVGVATKESHQAIDVTAVRLLLDFADTGSRALLDME
jgi:hypothetical protein